MAITRKNPLPLILPIPHSLVCAIGHVMTQWAYFEKQVDEEIKQLGMLSACINVKRPTKNPHEKEMLKLWRDMSRAAYVEKDDRRMVELIYDSACKLRDDRNKVAHGRWAGEDGMVSRLCERRGEFIDITDPKEASTAIHKMERVARQISGMNETHQKLQARTLNIREPSWDG